MPTSENANSQLSQLAALTREFAVVTADASTHDVHRPLSEFLARVRAALGMDIAFVSQFVDDQRVFRVVSVAAQGLSPVAPGNSDPLVDSYCKRVLEGRLPRAIPDAGALPEARNLAITERLRIGAYLSVPIVLRGGEVFGTLCCFSHLARPELGEEHVLGLQDVANVIAAGISVEGGFGRNPWASE
jgi:GAF domain-containing protein